MLHPSYADLMRTVNSEVGEGDSPVVNSRYSIVMATSKRARQVIDGCVPLVSCSEDAKPLSIAIAELNSGKVKILGESEEPEGEEDVVSGEDSEKDKEDKDDFWKNLGKDEEDEDDFWKNLEKNEDDFWKNSEEDEDASGEIVGEARDDVSEDMEQDEPGEA